MIREDGAQYPLGARGGAAPDNCHGSESRDVERVGFATRRPDCTLFSRCSGGC
jgi:hypothetical protein